MDMGMLRPDYEKFCRIAPEKLKPEFFFQNWYSEPNYGLPFGKVMKRGTVYLEGKKTRRLKENGFYVDIFPFDNAPENGSGAAKAGTPPSLHLPDEADEIRLPALGGGRTLPLEKAAGVLFYYQLKSLFVSQHDLAKGYDALAVSYPESQTVQQQYPGKRNQVFPPGMAGKSGTLHLRGGDLPGPRGL